MDQGSSDRPALTGAALEEFFAPGVRLTDLPALDPLIRGRHLLDAFITLFRGGEHEVLIRLLIMRELGSRPDVPRWSPQEIAAHFAYLDPVKLDTVLKRLRDFKLLVWDSEDRSYQLSGAGRITLSALANILELGGGEDADLAYITSQVAAGQAMGKPSLEALSLLLAKYRELQDEFDSALVSGSEFRIRRARAKLESVWASVEKGSEIIAALTQTSGLDGAMYRNAQAIGQAQSRILRMTAAFQRTLNALEQHRVHLGASGVSSSDVIGWLRSLDQVRLAELAAGVLHTSPQPQFVASDVLLDNAEYELIDRERMQALDTPLPAACDGLQADGVETERLLALEEFTDALAAIETPTPLSEPIVGGDYVHAAYRLSLLALLGDPDSTDMRGSIAEFARLPLTVDLHDEPVAVGRDEVAELSAGILRPVAAPAPPELVTGDAVVG